MNVLKGKKAIVFGERDDVPAASIRALASIISSGREPFIFSASSC